MLVDDDIEDENEEVGENDDVWVIVDEGEESNNDDDDENEDNVDFVTNGVVTVATVGVALDVHLFGLLQSHDNEHELKQFRSGSTFEYNWLWIKSKKVVLIN